MLRVDPQAIEQPLDLSVPENKMMLAFYLAAPEVENDRRALNVFHGMRRAKKEGRWMGTAPLGYVNKMTEDQKKYIAIHEVEAALLKYAFQQIVENNFNTEQIWKMVKQKAGGQPRFSKIIFGLPFATLYTVVKYLSRHLKTRLDTLQRGSMSLSYQNLFLKKCRMSLMAGKEQ